MSVQQLSLLGTMTAVYALVALSLVVLTGWTGQISLGQFAIVGVGAVAAGNLLAEAHADLFLALLGAGGRRARHLGCARVAGAAGAGPVPPGHDPGPGRVDVELLPQPHLREVGDPGRGGPARRARPVRPRPSEGNLFLFCVAVLAVAVVVVVNLRRRRPGRAWLAVRDNEWAAEARGVSLARTRLAAFAVSGALAGLAGGLHVIALNGVSVGTYAPSLSFEAFSMVVVGGLTSVWGAIFGAIALRYAEYVVSGGLQLIVTGAGVLFLLLVFPGGLGEVGLRIRRFGLDRIARRRGITDGGPPVDDAVFERVLAPDAAAETSAVALTDEVQIGDRGGGALGSRRRCAVPVRQGSGCRLRIAAGPVRRRLRRPPGRGRGPARHQRRREVDAGAGPVGPHPGPTGDGHLRRARHHRRQPGASRPPRHRPRPGRAGRLSRPHGGGEPPPGHVDVPGRQATLRRGHGTGLRALPHPSPAGEPSPPGCSPAASSRCWPWPRRWPPIPGC